MTYLDLRLNKRLHEKLDIFKRRSGQRKSRVTRSRNFLRNATALSKKDLTLKFKTLSKKPTPKEALKLTRNMFNSSVWIGQSSLRYIHSLVDFTTKGDSDVLGPKQLDILKSVQQGALIEDSSDEEIFKTIYNEMEYSHYYPDHKSLLKIPKANATLVLIPGVFNEIFSTPAFERAAQHLQDKTGNKYFSLKINGFKSCAHNVKLIKEQLEEYVHSNPDEKLWLISFSKGGLDALHFLSSEREFANAHIAGISTIASPILGSDHLNHRIFKFFNHVHNFSDFKIYKMINEKSDIMAREFQESMSSTFQRPWLRKNHENLPDKLFYTALGFESEFYDSHLWMMLTKAIFRSRIKNDGIVDTENSLFPYYFKRGINLGVLNGHHLVGTRSSYFCQEALFESLIIFLTYKQLL